MRRSKKETTSSAEWNVNKRTRITTNVDSGEQNMEDQHNDLPAITKESKSRRSIAQQKRTHYERTHEGNAYTNQKRSEAQKKRRERERMVSQLSKTLPTLRTTGDVIHKEVPVSERSLNDESNDNATPQEKNYIHDHISEENSEDEVQPYKSNDYVRTCPRGMKRHSLGKMDVECSFCRALHWENEKLTISTKDKPKFGKCCLQGKIRLTSLRTPPPQLKALYDGEHDFSNEFKRNIRRYNAINAFTSLGFTMPPRILNGIGPTVFTIHGELRHRTGSLLPELGEDPRYSQLYIYDPLTALAIRTRKNEDLIGELLEIIQTTLLEHNHFIPKYNQALAILQQMDVVEHNLPVRLHYDSSTDKRRYNLPTSDDITVLLPGDGTQITGARDIVLRLRGGNGLTRISECHPAYLPLHYVLLFPYGELGWEPEMKQWDVSRNCPKNDHLTQLQYYSYRIFDRTEEYSTILRGGPLFQEFLVDGWAATEQNRLSYVRQNQHVIRSELYKGLADMVEDGLSPNEVGNRCILPSSFTGSARHMFEIYQDSMAITRYHHHPDIFLTMTANPNWPEIKDALKPMQNATDRPDLVARVFEQKRKSLMYEIEKNNIFGKSVAHVYTIEFQKRGLPHMHALILLQSDDKIRTAEQVDRIVCAEFPDEATDPLLFDTIKSCMIHGPCGERNWKAPCMENGKCTKGYPKDFTETTTLDEHGYPRYRRSDDGRVFYTKWGKKITNEDVVPYNPYLSRMFNCHINVEVCAGIRCVKYINKYIYKGHDRTTIIQGGADEIQQYLDARYIGPPEAAWRIFRHVLHEENPNVVRLALHLKGMHQVVYNTAEPPDVILERGKHQKTTLTAFFEYCKSNPWSRIYTYQEFPQHCKWDNKGKEWSRREKGFAIGMVYFASPNAGERFYLRLLLTVVKGPTSFEYLRRKEIEGTDVDCEKTKIENGVVDEAKYHATYKEACIARGLLEDDGEWIQCLEEAAVMKTGYQLRRLFSIILTECSPIKPDELWNRFALHLCDDLEHRLRTTNVIQHPTEGQVLDYGLYLLNLLLQESGKNLTDFPPMPLPTHNWSQVTGNRLIWEHRQLQLSIDEHKDVSAKVNCLNWEQREAYNVVMDSVNGNKGLMFFLNGGAGTGKTFLYNTIASSCRHEGHIVVTVAFSGIASLLLVGGRTAHSTFCIPLDVLENSNCGFKKQSIHAELFRETKLIIWDEVPMQHRHCVEAVDRSLQDARDNKRPFGGITVVLGGDFRQILPVIPKGVRGQIVAASLRRSNLWTYINVLTLKQNMRLSSEDIEKEKFAKFLLQIGTNPTEKVQLPQLINRCNNLTALINCSYPGIQRVGTVSPEFLTERAILSSRNDDVASINGEILNMVPGEVRTYLATDNAPESEGNSDNNGTRYPTEFLNSLNPPGLPPFKLQIKEGCPIMLLRNLAPKEGLCNGTRLMVVRSKTRIIEARILTGDKAGNLVFIPRISLTPSSTESPVQMKRRKFPVHLAYAMTINKSHGQSVRFMGIDLRTPVFTHGQLYVALSRCTSTRRINVLLPEEEGETNSTTNIVYPEVLL